MNLKVEEELQISVPSHMLIFCSLKFINQLIKNFGFNCPDCGKKTYEVIPTKKEGIRQFLTIKCLCGNSSGGYSMPHGSNYSFISAMLNNGLSFQKLNDFLLMMNLNVDLKTKFFRKITAKVSLNIIKITERSIRNQRDRLTDVEVRYVALDGSYSQNNNNSQFVFVSAITAV